MYVQMYIHLFWASVVVLLCAVFSLKRGSVVLCRAMLLGDTPTLFVCAHIYIYIIYAIPRAALVEMASGLSGHKSCLSQDAGAGNKQKIMQIGRLISCGMIQFMTSLILLSSHQCVPSNLLSLHREYNCSLKSYLNSVLNVTLLHVPHRPARAFISKTSAVVNWSVLTVSGER